MTPDGKGTVLSVNVLRQLVRVAVVKKEGDTEAGVYSAEVLQFTPSQKKKDEEDNEAIYEEFEE